MGTNTNVITLWSCIYTFWNVQYQFVHFSDLMELVTKILIPLFIFPGHIYDDITTLNDIYISVILVDSQISYHWILSQYCTNQTLLLSQDIVARV